MKRKGMSPQDVGHVGGWKDPTTLEMIYQQPDPDTMQEVVDAGERKRLER